jgi:hypothetical protein
VARRQNGDVERAGGFLFVWGARDADGRAQGTVWRDNTEQDFRATQEGFIRESILAGIDPEFAESVQISGSETGTWQGVDNLAVAAGWLWGYHAGTADAKREGNA